ncbi:hypothetical protein L7F22_006884 [Adiantum nelumboides]|nr:hypothetical protein [Adiantum nelumboides]
MAPNSLAEPGGSIQVKGIGAQTALKLVRQHGSLESIIENLSKDRYQIPESWPYKEARQLFKEPLVTSEQDQTELKWSPPDEEELRKFLVEENGFNNDRIMKAIEKIKAAKNKSSQGRLDSFFKPTAIAESKGTPVPPKRKDVPDTKNVKPGAKKTKTTTKGKK